MTQTAEGALGEMENILQRIRELAVQAGNSTLSSTDRIAIQEEVTALTNEINNIAESTNFNRVKLLDGSNSSLNFQLGIDAVDQLTVELESSKVSDAQIPKFQFPKYKNHRTNIRILLKFQKAFEDFS